MMRAVASRGRPTTHPQRPLHSKESRRLALLGVDGLCVENTEETSQMRQRHRANKIRPKRLAAKWALIGLVAAGLVVLAGGVASHGFGAWSPEPADIAICPINTCVKVSGSTASPLLYPGAQPSTMPVTFTNLTNGPIYVTSLVITFNNTWQSTTTSSCSPADFQITDNTVAGSTVSTSGSTSTITFPKGLTVGPSGSTNGPTWTDSPALAMLDTQRNQDVCQGQKISLGYTGTAQYTVPTTAALATTNNASGDSVTLTATVSPDVLPAAAGRAPGSSDGVVQFFECAPSTTSPSGYSCDSSPIGTGTWSATQPGIATYTMPAGTVGSYNFEAVFVPNSGSTDFTSSTSQIVSDTLSGCVSVPTRQATTIWGQGTTISGNYTVAGGASLWLSGGTINGNVTVAAGGQLAISGGTVNGNVQSTGGAIAISGATITGNLQMTSGGLSLGPSAVVKGNVQAQGGGPLCSQGASPTQGQVQIRGNLLVQSITSQTTSSVCSTNVGTNLIWQNNSSTGLIGSCGGNIILGNLQVQNNTGKVTVGAGPGNGNVTSGNTIVQSNTGGGSLSGNSSGGNCLLSSNAPGIVGSGNSATGHNNQCNARA